MAVDRLKRELERSAEAAGCTIDFIGEGSGPVNHPRYDRVDHSFSMQVEGPANNAWLDTLDDDALYVPGFVLVDLDVYNIEASGSGVIADLSVTTVREA
ncbi:hypothetical protein SPHS6_00830 [Sphingobium sp. S6]|nr:hypothetical protein SPHS6_00830 [Sphingobium sp. S6]CAD7336141.1 hypothetical protein SPHS8_00870 [Sphingobium sp. S8]